MMRATTVYNHSPHEGSVTVRGKVLLDQDLRSQSARGVCDRKDANCCALKSLVDRTGQSREAGQDGAGTGQDRRGQDRAERGRGGHTEQDRTGQGRAGRGDTGQARTRQEEKTTHRTGQGKMGRDGTGQDRTRCALKSQEVSYPSTTTIIQCQQALTSSSAFICMV